MIPDNVQIWLSSFMLPCGLEKIAKVRFMAFIYAGLEKGYTRGHTKLNKLLLSFWMHVHLDQSVNNFLCE